MLPLVPLDELFFIQRLGVDEQLLADQPGKQHLHLRADLGIFGFVGQVVVLRRVVATEIVQLIFVGVAAQRIEVVRELPLGGAHTADAVGGLYHHRLVVGAGLGIVEGEEDLLLYRLVGIEERLQVHTAEPVGGGGAGNVGNGGHDVDERSEV